MSTNHAPTAQDGHHGTPGKGMSHTRSIATLAPDPDNDSLTYELVETGFSRTGFKFSWNTTTGSFSITIPAGNGGSSYLKFRVKDSSGAVSRTATVKLDFVV